jgi:hypothetical protein
MGREDTIYVVVRFRPGYPEVSDHNLLFRGLKVAGRFGEGTPGAEIRAQVAPQLTEVIVTKRRVGAFPRLTWNETVVALPGLSSTCTME